MSDRCVAILAAAIALAGTLGVAPEAARGVDPPADGPLAVYAYTFAHRSAADVVDMVRNRLSARGAVELRPRENTIVVRDVSAVIATVAPLLRGVDLPPRPFEVELQLLRAGPEGSEAPEGRVASDLIDRLRNLLRFENYDLLARAAIRSHEGEAVTYALGDRWSVRYRVGALVAEDRVRLEGFRVLRHPQSSPTKSRRPPPRELVHSHLNLWLEKPFALVLTPAIDGQKALLVAVTCRRSEG